MSYDDNQAYWDDVRNRNDDIRAALNRQERLEEDEEYQNALAADLDNRANDRLGQLPDNTWSELINTLLATTGDRQDELIEKYNEWLFDVCRAVEEELHETRYLL
ncbi:hypothetical protein [Xenorhabdus griffiniae]|uniref:Host-nuclease inhibitor protein Gam n=1 Tax=Xenorhabdus griffiniae TaxID=351672 RepID=A0ABY9XMF5_9GAMM|nr:hypothetical protein [Xenorhabdus griffiniae]MBD1229648.1 hypothetical protein [Xenorhabdus griffiniae]MBE8589405.1 hypothetical protein [Xenorhabdus griffiniae]WMV74004.1 hypothetical protein QL128_08420 [Xenorhabdus griffiniae]WNH03684.1 hypothetical protein QL112_008425 [Xenorhabdus griffiniae]